MKALAMFACMVSAPWIAVFGIVQLILGNGVLEVLDLEMCALVLVALAGVLLVDDIAGPRR